MKSYAQEEKEENDKTGCKLNFGHECIITGEEVIYSKRKLKYYFLKIMWSHCYYIFSFSYSENISVM